MITTSLNNSSEALSVQIINDNPPKARNQVLDAIRGVAILLVLSCHVPPLNPGVLRPVASFFVRFGWIGVDLFFVLSGFLIGGLLFKEANQIGRINIRRFLMRRAFKLWPAYFALLFYAGVRHVYGAHISIQAGIQSIAPNLFHLQNYFGTIRLHTWSLAIEEHFYLFLPVALSLMLRRKSILKVQLLITAAVICSSCLLCRATSLSDVPYNYLTHLTPTHIRIDSLMFGVVLAYIQNFESRVVSVASKYWWLLAFSGSLLIFPFCFVDSGELFVYTAGYTLLYLGFGLILFGFYNRNSSTDLPISKAIGGFLATIGTYSYTIYLWHWDLARAPTWHLFELSQLSAILPELRWALAIAFYFAAAIAFGVVMNWLIDRPFLTLRDKLVP